MPQVGKLPLIATAFLLVVLVVVVIGRQPSLCKRLTGPTPIMISAPGDYCFATNIDAPAGRPAIIITADDVAIDLSAFSLSSCLCHRRQLLRTAASRASASSELK